MNRGFVYSIILHATIALLLYVGIPHYSHHTHSSDYTIVLDVVPISSITNLKASLNKGKRDRNVTQHNNKDSSVQEQQSEHLEKQPAAQKLKESQPKNVIDKTVEVHKVMQEKSVDQQYEKLPAKIAKSNTSNKKMREVKNAVEKITDKKDSLSEKKTVSKIAKNNKVKQEWDRAVMKSLETIKKTNKNGGKNTSKQEEVHKKGNVAGAKGLANGEDDDIWLTGETNKEYNPDLPISISEQDAIRSQIERSWNQAYYGAGYLAHENKQAMHVKIKISLAIDGTVLDVKVVEGSGTTGNTLYSKFIDSAIRAVYNASPLHDLPSESLYDVWREIQFVFNSDGNIS